MKYLKYQRKKIKDSSGNRTHTTVMEIRAVNH